MPTYLITFHTYGTWLHGDARGSVDPDHNARGEPFIAPSASLLTRDVERMRDDSVVLNDAQRSIVDEAIRAVCSHRGWGLHALHVRTNHVHIVLTAAAPPERVMNSLKSWSTRCLAEVGLFDRGRKAWSRHGSTRWIDTEASFDAACRYVLEEQGKPFGADARRRAFERNASIEHAGDPHAP